MEFKEAINQKNILYFKSITMKNQNQHRTAFSLFFSQLAKNFSALFASGNNREFKRLKDFISS